MTLAALVGRQTNDKNMRKMERCNKGWIQRKPERQKHRTEKYRKGHIDKQLSNAREMDTVDRKIEQSLWVERKIDTKSTGTIETQ